MRANRTRSRKPPDGFPFRARISTRLSQKFLGDICCELRADSQVASAYPVSWTLAIVQLSSFGELVGNVDRMFIRSFRFDEQHSRIVLVGTSVPVTGVCNLVTSWTLNLLASWTTDLTTLYRQNRSTFRRDSAIAKHAD